MFTDQLHAFAVDSQMPSYEQVREQMKQYEAAMKDPKIQEQTQQLQQVMQSPEMMKKMAELKVRFADLEL